MSAAMNVTIPICVLKDHNPPFNAVISDLDCLGVLCPTVRDFLDYVAEIHHLECGCQCVLGEKTWIVRKSKGADPDDPTEADLVHPSAQLLNLVGTIDADNEKVVVVATVERDAQACAGASLRVILCFETDVARGLAAHRVQQIYARASREHRHRTPQR